MPLSRELLVGYLITPEKYARLQELAPDILGYSDDIELEPEVTKLLLVEGRIHPEEKQIGQQSQKRRRNKATVLQVSSGGNREIFEVSGDINTARQMSVEDLQALGPMGQAIRLALERDGERRRIRKREKKSVKK